MSSVTGSVLGGGLTILQAECIRRLPIAVGTSTKASREAGQAGARSRAPRASVLETEPPPPFGRSSAGADEESVLLRARRTAHVGVDVREYAGTWVHR